MKPIIASVAVVVCLSVLSVGHAGRFQNFTKKYESPQHPAKVVASSYLGGEGTEWLVGGGFQPDGTVVLVGVSLGPSLSIGGKSATVIGGADNPAPPQPEVLYEKDAKGNVRKNKNGTPKVKPFGWDHDAATAFIVRLASDYKTVESVTRLPWRVGGATSAKVGSDGAIYLAGPANAELVGKLGGNVRMFDAPALDTKVSPRTVYVAKVTANGADLEWLRHQTGPAAAPEVKVSQGGDVLFRGVDLRTISPAGIEKSVTVVPTGLGEHHAVNPVDGTIAYGHEHHWRTGREPWRCPILNIHEPDGTLKYQLYDWGGPFVGLNNLRLVSDSAIRAVEYDADGNLLIYAWSDGGNSVMTRKPFDVRRSANMEGLGMSPWGAGVLSCAYLIRIDTKTYDVIGGTMWLAYLSDQDKPNSIWIRKLGFGADGSVVVGGDAAWGLIQTGNHLNPGGEPGGPYVAVFNDTLDTLRFSSAMPACGKSDVANGEEWGIATGKIGGRTLAIALCGATEKGEGYHDGKPAPTVNAAQTKFGGGHLDGHFLVLDLTK